MRILYAFSSRCILGCERISLSSITHNNLKPIHSSLKSILPNRYQFVTSRHFSWDGFYTSISSSTPVLTFQSTLLDFHSNSGLPWWAVIALTTLCIRSFFVFPLAVHQNQVIGRFANLNAELGKMAPELNKEVNIARRMYGWDEKTAKRVFKKNMRQYYQKFVVRDNCHPFKIVLLAIFQIPIWICFSVSLRNLTMNHSFINCDIRALVQQLKSEGTLWFKDLTVPDTFVIPIFLAFVNLALIEFHSLRRIGEKSKLQKALLYIMRFFVIIVAGAAAINPASVSFYWLCSSTFGLAQSVILLSPRFRHILRIPQMANESSTPFKDIASNFRKRFMS